MSGSSQKSTPFVVGSSPPSAREGKAWAEIVRHLTEEALAPGARLRLAHRVRETLELWVPLAVPQRPPTMAADPTILSLLRKRHATDRRIAKVHRDALALFGTWRYAVWRQEAASASRLETLARAILIAREEKRPELTEELEEWLATRWELSLPLGIDDRELAHWAEVKAARLDILPVHLRTEEAPKGWKLPKVSGKSKAKADEDEVNSEDFSDA